MKPLPEDLLYWVSRVLEGAVMPQDDLRACTPPRLAVLAHAVLVAGDNGVNKLTRDHSYRKTLHYIAVRPLGPRLPEITGWEPDNLTGRAMIFSREHGLHRTTPGRRLRAIVCPHPDVTALLEDPVRRRAAEERYRQAAIQLGAAP